MLSKFHFKENRNEKMRLIYIVNNLGFFVSHRISLAIHAKASGFDVLVIAGSGGSETLEDQAEKVIKRCGINFKRLKYRGASFQIFDDLIGIAQLFIIIHHLAPNLIHCISPKGVLYGGLASKFQKKCGRVFSISGMGTLFTDLNSKSIFIKILSQLYRALFKIAFSGKSSQIIVQNSQDLIEIKKFYNCEKNSLNLIPGVGICIADYISVDRSKKEKIVLLPARMIWEKGIREFVSAANKIYALHPDWKFLLAGIADYEHPSKIPKDWLEAVSKKGNIFWIGHCDDMVAQYKKAHIVCLPSYREGFPKALMEAAAAGCAIITSNATGCREAIIEGVTGDLVEIKNEQQLYEKLLRLIENPEVIEKYALAGRKMAFKKYDENEIIKDTIGIYDRLISTTKLHNEKQ